MIQSLGGGLPGVPASHASDERTHWFLFCLVSSQYTRKQKTELDSPPTPFIQSAAVDTLAVPPPFLSIPQSHALLSHPVLSQPFSSLSSHTIQSPSHSANSSVHPQTGFFFYKYQCIGCPGVVPKHAPFITHHSLIRFVVVFLTDFFLFFCNFLFIFKVLHSSLLRT